MQFPIELRHAETGQAQNFPDKQAVADFLQGRNKSEWEGWQNLGELTAAVAEAAPEEPVMADADPDHGEPEMTPEQKVAYDAAAAAAETIAAPDVDLSVSDTGAATESAS